MQKQTLLFELYLIDSALIRNYVLFRDLKRLLLGKSKEFFYLQCTEIEAVLLRLRKYQH